MNDAVPTRLIENDRVRVTEWKFPPDSHTGWHRHEWIMSSCRLPTGSST